MTEGRSARHITPGGNCSSTIMSPSTSGGDSRARRPPQGDQSRRQPRALSRPPAQLHCPRWACPRPSRRGYCINCGRRGEEIANCSRCGERHQARQQDWEARESPAQGTNETQARGRSRTREDTPREPQQSPSPAGRNRQREEEESRAQRMPPPPVVPVTNLGATSYQAQILRDTRDVEPELRDQILRVVLGECGGAGSPDRPASVRPQ